MKLLEEILSNENMNKAYQQVYRNKGASGVDGISTKDLAYHLRKNKDDIRNQIRKRTYQPLPVLRVEIPKDNGKMRKLGIPTAVDRVIQQAISQKLSPIFEQQFSEYSFGFRPGRSCEQAINKVLEFINDGHTWLIDIDLERLFDTVHHDKLMRIISHTIKDGDVISLIRKYLTCGVMVNGKIESTPVGTPQGGNLSPLLSNIMLNELDKELEARNLNFVRYADDSIIFVKSKKAANRVMKSVTHFIEKKLGLIVNAEKSRISRPGNIKFIGFGFDYDAHKKKDRPRVHQESVHKFQRKLKQLTKRNQGISLNNRIIKLKQVIYGWVNYFKIAKMKSILTNIDAKLRSRKRDRKRGVKEKA